MSALGWTPGQQGKIRPTVDRAWAVHCRDTGTDPRDKATRREWYEGVLCRATGGKRTSRECDRGDDFDEAWAAFEQIAGDGIEAQMALIQGRLRRVRFLIQRRNPRFLARFSSDRVLADWLVGIARQAGSRAEVLAALTRAEMQTVRRAALIAAGRAGGGD